ncbi:MAG: toll/interleukin-1 receptor domain-containing protein, partial [Sedimenticolaceae bacterium]
MLISYKREDQLPARQLADVFERQGWSVWWDPKLRAGESFDDVIEKALIAARCFVVVWSRRSIDSTYVKDEATYALNRNKLVPLSIEEVELPFRFEWIHTPRLIDWDGKEEAPAFQSILRDIIVIIGPSPGMEEMRQIRQESDLTAD